MLWPTVAYSPIAGMPAITIPGCDPDCCHEWVEHIGPDKRGGIGDKSTLTSQTSQFQSRRNGISNYCLRCGGWRGGLGQEPTIEAYIGHMILCVREWWRVLRDDGTLWLNIGDSYAGSWGNYGARNGNQRSRVVERWQRPAYEDEKEGWNGLPSTANVAGLKPKNLCMVPARLALALQADGWYLRHVVPWVKRNALPGSQQDRPTTAHEYIYLFAKSERYFYDQDAVRLPYAPGVDCVPGQPNKSATFARRKGSKEAEVVPGQGYATHRDGREEEDVYQNGGRFRRDSDWFFDSLRFLVDGGQGLLQNENGEPLALVVNTRGYSGAHFAVWPATLVEPMILASTSEYGVCGVCGAPWKRMVEKEGQQPGRERNRGGRADDFALPAQWENGENPTIVTTTGWQPTCQCGGKDVVPAVVLDPFHGSGTSGRVAVMHRRDYVGVDISADYLEEHDRISGVQIRLV